MKLEKHADMCIADHTNPRAPPGAYSFQFLEHATKNGELPDKESYLIKPAVSGKASGKVAPAAGGRSTRTKFTPADDAELVHFMLPQMRKGESLRGNLLFEKLEKQV